jgi:hypothetical protein
MQNYLPLAVWLGSTRWFRRKKCSARASERRARNWTLIAMTRPFFGSINPVIGSSVLPDGLLCKLRDSSSPPKKKCYSFRANCCVYHHAVRFKSFSCTPASRAKGTLKRIFTRRRSPEKKKSTKGDTRRSAGWETHKKWNKEIRNPNWNQFLLFGFFTSPSGPMKLFFFIFFRKNYDS